MSTRSFAAEPPADRPEWLRRRERGSAWLYRLIAGLALALGRAPARCLLPPIAAYFLVFSGASRRASMAYLGRALGRPAGLAQVFRHYRSFAAVILDRVFLLKGRTDLFDIRVSGEEMLTRMVAEGSGCILLGAHLGSFEVMRAVGRRHGDRRVRMVMFESNARKIGLVLRGLDPRLAADIIALGQPDSFVEIERALETGEFVGLLADRALTDKRQVAVPFLGSDALFPTDPFRMLAILKQPVVLMAGLYRGGNRYEVHFERFAAAEAMPRRPDAEALRACVAAYAARLDHYCRLAPYNWFNFYDFWR